LCAVCVMPILAMSLMMGHSQPAYAIVLIPYQQLLKKGLTAAVELVR